MKKIFLTYLIWHALASYTLLSDFALYFPIKVDASGNAVLVAMPYIQLFNYLNTAFLTFAPILHFVYKKTAKPKDLYWLQMCLACLGSKYVFMCLAVLGCTWYAEIYALTMFMVLICYLYSLVAWSINDYIGKLYFWNNKH